MTPRMNQNVMTPKGEGVYQFKLLQPDGTVKAVVAHDRKLKHTVVVQGLWKLVEYDFAELKPL